MNLLGVWAGVNLMQRAAGRRYNNSTMLAKLHSFTLLGIDADKEYADPLGRPVPLVNGGKVIPGLLA